jgi:hypothetical protein
MWIYIANQIKLGSMGSETLDVHSMWDLGFPNGIGGASVLQPSDFHNI